jgi:hypothetical protein
MGKILIQFGLKFETICCILLAICGQVRQIASVFAISTMPIISFIFSKQIL